MKQPDSSMAISTSDAAPEHSESDLVASAGVIALASSPSLSRSSSSTTYTSQTLSNSTFRAMPPDEDTYTAKMQGSVDDELDEKSAFHTLRKVKKNRREKRRRDDLNGYFDTLRDLLLIEPAKHKVEKRKVLSECIRILENIKREDSELFLSARSQGPRDSSASTAHLNKAHRKHHRAPEPALTVYASTTPIKTPVTTAGTVVPAAQTISDRSIFAQPIQLSTAALTTPNSSNSTQLFSSTLDHTQPYVNQTALSAILQQQQQQQQQQRYQLQDNQAYTTLLLQNTQPTLLNFQPQFSLNNAQFSLATGQYNPSTLQFVQQTPTARTDFTNWPLGLTPSISATAATTLPQSSTSVHPSVSLSSNVNINVATSSFPQQTYISSLPTSTLFSPNTSASQISTIPSVLPSRGFTAFQLRNATETDSSSSTSSAFTSKKLS